MLARRPRRSCPRCWSRPARRSAPGRARGGPGRRLRWTDEQGVSFSFTSGVFSASAAACSLSQVARVGVPGHDARGSSCAAAPASPPDRWPRRRSAGAPRRSTARSPSTLERADQRGAQDGDRGRLARPWLPIPTRANTGARRVIANLRKRARRCAIAAIVVVDAREDCRRSSPQICGIGVDRRGLGQLEDVGGRLQAGHAEGPAVEQQAELVDRRRAARSASRDARRTAAARRACGSSRSGRR